MSKDNYTSFFKDKNITVMGLGVLGRGIGDVKFLAQCGARLTVTDLKTREQLAPALEQLKGCSDIQFTLSEHKEKDFTSADMVIKAAGVPLDSPYITAAKNAGVPVYMSTALFAKFCPATLIGVTGTRGKSTVTQLVYEVLKNARKNTFLGGNVRGLSTLAQLPNVKENDYVVLELDSWQLQGFRDLKISPHISVFTTFMPDHMNYYNGDVKAYFHDKAAIFENQNEKDFIVTGENVSDSVQLLNPKSKCIKATTLPKEWELSLSGEHNRQNAACALEALRILGVGDKIIRRTFENIKALEGRLENLGTINGITFYNDTNATTPEALTVAIKSFNPENLLLICGGADKELELKGLEQTLIFGAREIALLEGTGTDILSAALADVPVYTTLKDAFEALIKSAKSGDTILLSPGFASFGMFKNEYDRGDQFKKLVSEYKERKSGQAA